MVNLDLSSTKLMFNSIMNHKTNNSSAKTDIYPPFHHQFTMSSVHVDTAGLLSIYLSLFQPSCYQQAALTDWIVFHELQLGFESVPGHHVIISSTSHTNKLHNNAPTKQLSNNEVNSLRSRWIYAAVTYNDSVIDLSVVSMNHFITRLTLISTRLRIYSPGSQTQH